MTASSAPQHLADASQRKQRPIAVGAGPSAKQIDKVQLLLGRQRLDEAESAIRSLLVHFPRNGFCWKLLGVALWNQQRPADALLPMQEALRLMPTDAEAHKNLGVALLELRRYPEAETCLREALRLAPNSAEIHMSLGSVLQQSGRPDEAEAIYRSALKCHTVLAIPAGSLGDIYNNLGNTLRVKGCLTEAEASYLRSLELRPNVAQVYDNLGSALLELGKFSASQASFRQALQIAPAMASAHSNLLFCASNNADVSPAELFTEHLRFAEQFEAPLRPHWPAHTNSREPERRLQIGLVSGDLRNHAVAFFLEPILAKLASNTALSIHAYSNHVIHDAVSQRLQSHVAHWHAIADLSDAALAEKIIADRIDILIDLSGHTGSNRLLTFARKPAPVQASWIGYPGSTGLRAMDYFFSDSCLLPPGQFDDQFTEKLAYLPASATFLPNPDAPPVNALPALGNGYLTFGSFNRPSKLNPGVIALWSQLLRAIPNARMLLGAMPTDGDNTQLISWFAAEGIAVDRLDFHPRAGMADYLALHQQVDFCLDTFPYAGGTTTLHALWMGVPTLTLAGNTVAGRSGAGILAQVGLDQFIAQSAEEFVRNGLTWAGNPAALAEIRSSLRERFISSPYSQPATVANGLAAALRTMWRRWCNGQPAESFHAETSHSPNIEQELQNTLETVLQQAMQLHQAGHAQEAEMVCRAILESQPAHAKTNHLLGLLVAQSGDIAHALRHFQAALEADPVQGQYWLNFIDALILDGQIEKAEQYFRLGRDNGLEGEEIDKLEQRISAADISTHSLTELIPPLQLPRLSTAQQYIEHVQRLLSEERHAEAEKIIHWLPSQFPQDGSCWKLLGLTLWQQRRFEQALPPMLKAVKLLPRDAESQRNLGITQLALKRYGEAEASLRSSIEISPTYAEAHNSLGITLYETGRLDEAQACYRRVLQLRPDFADSYNNLANILKETGHLSEAAEMYSRFLQTHPDHAGVHDHVGCILFELGRFDEAEVSFRQALDIAPGYACAHSNLLFCTSNNADVSPAELFAEHLRFAEQFEAPLRPHWPAHTNSREPERRLQIGLVSGDLRNHAVAFFLEPILAKLASNTALSIHAYSNHVIHDAVSQRLQSHVAHWHAIADLSDAALAEKIIADRIDILIDLSGHTGSNRLLTFARKPAPVQASWIGYPGSTGLRAMDYFFSDSCLLPPGQFDDQFTEKLAYLPASATFLPNPDAPPVNALPALDNGYLTFGSFNRPSKLNPGVIALWSQLLRAIPNARMLLGAMPTDGDNTQLISWFAAEGIAVDRLDFHPRAGMADYLTLHQQVDFCLDTFPYAGGTTTLHALWMGVPTLTLAGNTVAGRSGAGILAQVGLDQFIAQSAEEFVRNGLTWAGNPAALAEIRSSLRERFISSPYSQPATVANGLAAALRTMWQRWCKDEAATVIPSIPPDNRRPTGGNP
ncbi:tetratricopeptide repeat protein [Collimonas arenae]|uniref:O-linked N-acetylglucosamine transferase family protein n=1 Tax=Collimonas arenae TaxID=279058 RepID=UPI000778434A|nr:tetratricopeptide repeat protein [Collimonas arenae]